MAGIRAVKKVDFEMNHDAMEWYRGTKWIWEHDYPVDKKEYGSLTFDEKTQSYCPEFSEEELKEIYETDYWRE